jgi:hypothetical protein
LCIRIHVALTEPEKESDKLKRVLVKIPGMCVETLQHGDVAKDSPR